MRKAVQKKKQKPPAKKTVKKEKTVRKKRQKSPRVGTIKKHCYDVYSLFVRLRDSGKNGEGKCITCDRVCFFYDDCADNGHMFSRRLMSTAFHPKNNNLQCKGCNGPGNGMQYEYGIAVDKKFGEGTAQELLSISRQTKKYAFLDFLELIEETLPQCYKLLKSKKLPDDVFDKLNVRLDFYKRYIERTRKQIES